jgi:hypothetical protein
MDATIADAINRRDVALICARLDALDLPQYRLSTVRPWHLGSEADALMSTDDRIRPDQAWIVGRLAAGIPGIAFDGSPADCDWDNLLQHFRNAISARRDPKTPHGQDGYAPLAEVV